MATRLLVLPRLSYRSVSLLLLMAALLGLAIADLRVTALDPWLELRRLLTGLLHTDVLAVEARSLVLTVAFAVVGVGIGATAGLALALVFPLFGAVRVLCAFLRSIHEMFWALLLINVTGLSPTTGILAIALPYSGIFAKVFSEMIEEADLAAVRVLPKATSTISAFAFARLPELAEQFKNYTLYRLECGLRSTLVLGFIGLPTIGFQLESYFRQGHYAQASGLLLSFYVLIGTRRLWARAATLPLLIVGSIAALAFLTDSLGGGSITVNLLRFFAEIVPRPLRGGDLFALAFHNGAIVGYLMGRHADVLEYRPDAPRGANLYFFETVPRLYGQFLAYVLYRWEIILRESAIFGILGVATLGFYVDAAISELKLDVAAVLILAFAALSMLVDVFSRRLRRGLRIDTMPTRLSAAPVEPR